MFNFSKKMKFFKKMGEELGKQRTIDVSVEKTLKSVKSGYRVVPNMEIKAWKAYLSVTFVAGFCAALIWSAYMSVYPVSWATESQYVTLSTYTALSSHKTGEEFPVEIFLNTAGRDIVAVQAIFDYDPNMVQVLSVDTSTSSFSQEIKNSVDAGAGQGFLALARPTPGINSQTAKIAVVNVRVLSDVNEPTLQLKFDSLNAVSDSASILDDGQGTNVLQRVTSFWGSDDGGDDSGDDESEAEADFSINSIAGLTDTIVRIGWTEGSHENKDYLIERKEGTKDFSRIGEVGSSEQIYVDRSVKYSKLYAYRVCQENSGENFCTEGERVKTLKKKKIVKPRLVARSEDGKITLSWSPTYTTDFKVILQRKAGKAKKYSTISVVSSNTQNSYLDEDVVPGTKYTYQMSVKASKKKTQKSKTFKIVAPSE